MLRLRLICGQIAAEGETMLGVIVTLLAAQVAAAPQPTGKIVLYRGSSMVGAAIGCPIRYKESELVELGRGKYAEWDVPPGRYILTNKTSSVEVSVEAGETRYVRCQIKAGFLTGRADLQIIDAESFSRHQADFERKEIVAQGKAQ